MPDITLCSNAECCMRDRCYRAQAKPDPLWQSWGRRGLALTCASGAFIYAPERAGEVLAEHRGGS